MNIQDIFKQANIQISKEDFVPIREHLHDEEFHSFMPSEDSFLKGIEFLEEDFQYFYLTKKGFSRYCYFNEGCFVEFEDFSIDFLKTMHVKERIQQSKKIINQLLDKKDYHTLFAVYFDSKIRFFMFKQLFDSIPDEDKYDIFMDIYISNDYGFKELGIDFVEKVLSYQIPEKRNKSMNEMKDLLNLKSEQVTIFRGEASDSTSYDEAYSWTTNLQTALFFATRFHTGKGRVVSTTIDVKDIIDFSNSRNEFEVLVHPENIKDATEIVFVPTAEQMELLDENWMISTFHQYAGQLSDELFFHPEGIHGLRHAKRVLLLSLCLALELELTDDEIQLLALTSIYHDIGRMNDWEDPEHGKRSFQKCLDLDLDLEFMDDSEEFEILKYIIENHDEEDNVAFSNLKNYKIYDTELALTLLKVLKDADALDRVRTGDLDFNYLRFPFSKKYYLFANDLLHFLK